MGHWLSIDEPFDAAVVHLRRDNGGAGCFEFGSERLSSRIAPLYTIVLFRRDGTQAVLVLAACVFLGHGAGRQSLSFKGEGGGPKTLLPRTYGLAA